MRLTEVLADYILAQLFEALSPKVVEQAKLFFKDCYGCMLAGAHEQAPLIAGSYCETLGARQVSSVISKKGFKTDPCSAAMVNGTSAHIHDYDDVSITVTGHPSVVVQPVVLALGEERGASGKDILTAYIAGIEVMALMGRALNPQHYQRGWHNTGTLGTFGAVAAAGLLLQLNRNQMINAIGIAASRAAGLKGNFGTMTKSLHAGLAASNGIFAAQMAALGFDANPDIMEMSGGFIPATSGEADLEAVTAFIAKGGSEFLEPGLAVKPFPSCKATHNGINAVMDLAAEHGFQPADVARVLVGCQPIAKDLLKYPLAHTPLQGKFSMNYCVACALVYGRVNLAHFQGEIINDSAVLDLMQKVHMEVNEEIAQGKYYNGTWETEATIILKDSTKLYKRVRYATGDPENPLSAQAVNEKFIDQANGVIKPENIEGLLDCLNHLENLNTVACLINKTEFIMD